MKNRFDQRFPRVAISVDKTPLINGQKTINFLLSEQSTNFELADVTVSNGTLSNLSGSGVRYSAIFTPPAQYTGYNSLRIVNGKFSDAAGNSNVDGSDPNNIALLHTGPRTVGVTRVGLLGEFEESPAASLELVRQADGKIVAAGRWGPIGDSSDFAILRFLPDGVLDKDFGNAGLVLADLGRRDWPAGVRIQSDQKIVVAGTSNYDFAAIRLNQTGSIDTTFGDQGSVIVDFGQWAEASRVLIGRP